MSLFRSTVKNTYRLTVELEGPGSLEDAIAALFAVGFVRERTEPSQDYGTGFVIQSVLREREVLSGDD